jgi:hypothetical protein
MVQDDVAAHPEIVVVVVLPVVVVLVPVPVVLPVVATLPAVIAAGAVEVQVRVGFGTIQP